MKQLFFLTACLVTYVLSAQTNTFNGSVDNNWTTPANWNLNVVPTALHDVVIPTGKSVTLNGSAATKSIQLVGTASFTMAGSVSILQASTIAANATLNWSSGNLLGGGTLTNAGSINIVPAGSKQILDGTILNNSGTITESTDWLVDIVNGTINNLASGVIDLKDSGTGIAGSGSGSHLLNNAGIIKKTGTNTSNITAEIHNTGTISAQSGTIQLNSAQTVLNGGIYNVSSGANMEWLSTLQFSGNLTGNAIGTINISGNMNVPTSAFLNITGTGGINWGNGHLSGGGSLTNLGTLWMTTTYASTKYIEGGTTFNNSGTINISSDWPIDIANGTLNNLDSGMIDLQVSSVQMVGNGTGTHILNNVGIIKKTIGTGTATINVTLHNTGTLSSEAGFIDLNNPLTTLTGGTFNTSADCQIRWMQTVTCSGTLSGTLNGAIGWYGNVAVPTAAQFNFTGAGNVYWSGGELNGGGILTNNGKLNQAAGGVKSITSATTFNNTAVFNITSDSGLSINNGTINNTASGTIDIQTAADIVGGTGLHALNNAGLLKKSASTGTANIGTITTNTGTIQTSQGRMTFDNLNNTGSGTVTGTAEIQLPAAANFTNNGTFAPGGSPGILTVIGDFKGTAASKIAVEINGLTQGTQYDKLAISGNAVTAGTISVTLGFAPVIGSEFIVATTSGAITSCNLAPTTVTAYAGNNYTFNVTCRNNNEVVLTLASITLGLADNTVPERNILLYPNPANGFITLHNQSGLNLTEATIVDFSGRIIKKLNLKGMSTDKNIPLDGMASGTYFMKINAGSNTYIKRFIRE